MKKEGHEFWVVFEDEEPAKKLVMHHNRKLVNSPHTLSLHLVEDTLSVREIREVVEEHHPTQDKVDNAINPMKNSPSG